MGKIIINFPGNPLFLALATGANTKTRDRKADNQELGLSSIESTFFGRFWPTPCNILHAMCAYPTKSPTAMPKRIAIISCIKMTTHPCCITDNNIVKHTAPIVEHRVPIFPGCNACAAHAVLKAKPVNYNNHEEVEEPWPPHIVSFLINDKYKLVDKPALLRQGPAPVRAAKQGTSIKFNGTEQEGVNPELACLYRTWQLKEVLPQFDVDFAVDACFSPLVHFEGPRTPLPPLLVANKPFSRLCCCAFPVLFRPALVKPNRQGHQAGRGANQPSCCQHHQNWPRADCRIKVRPPLFNLIAQRFTLNFEADSSQVIVAVLTTAVYFYLGRVAVALGSAQLAYFHAVIVFATFVPQFFDQKWVLLSF
jgi:hypothetical protein